MKHTLYAMPFLFPFPKLSCRGEICRSGPILPISSIGGLPVSIPAPQPAQSKGTRDPSFYDKLLADNFILRRVRSLPSLPKDIAGTVDRSLDAISALNINLPPFSEGFPTKSFRSHILKARPSAMKNEMSVAEFYGHTTAVFCVNVASVACITTFVSSG
jgi:hypothetical protein